MIILHYSKKKCFNVAMTILIALNYCTFFLTLLFRFRYRFRPKEKLFFGFGIGFGRKEKWLFRLFSVSAEMKKSLSVVH